MLNIYPIKTNILSLITSQSREFIESADKIIIPIYPYFVDIFTICKYQKQIISSLHKRYVGSDHIRIGIVPTNPIPFAIPIEKIQLFKFL